VSEAAGTDLHDWFARYVGGVEDPPFASALALAGLTLTTREEDGRTLYVVSEMPNATPEQLAVRHGWLTGTVTR
jgi:predicted metalloprotease with PDZ domain